MESIKHCTGKLYLLNAWAIHEHRKGGRQNARELFQAACKLDPGNVYVAKAWELLEQRYVTDDRAREIFRHVQGMLNYVLHGVIWKLILVKWKLLGSSFERFWIPLIVGEVQLEFYCARAETEARVRDMATSRGLLNKSLAEATEESEFFFALSRFEARRVGTKRALELMRAAAALSKKPDMCVFNHWSLI